MGCFTYACKDYPGMEACPGRFEAETEEELWKHIELHAKAAHEEDPASWPSEETAKVKSLIKKIEKPA
ncbi:MAG: DUF1059 domain-containing protein [Hyphomicrobiaceae bacterium]